MPDPWTWLPITPNATISNRGRVNLKILFYAGVLQRKKKNMKREGDVGPHFAVTHSLAHSLIGTRNIRHPFLAKIALLRGKELVSRALYRGCSSRVNRDSLEVFPAVDRTSILDSRLAWFTLRNLWNAWWKKSKLRSVEKNAGRVLIKSLTILAINLYIVEIEYFIRKFKSVCVHDNILIYLKDQF